MNIDEAINKAADHIERNPQHYSFGQGQVIRGHRACMLARIGEMAGMLEGTGHDVVAQRLLGMGPNEFYSQIAQVTPLDGTDPVRNVRTIPKAMRMVAKQFIGIPVNVREIFEPRIIPPPAPPAIHVNDPVIPDEVPF